MSTVYKKLGISKANLNQISGAIGTATLNRLVPQFSTSVAYTKGQYTNYQNVLYRFTADKSAGAWDSTKVETASLNDLIDDVNEAVASVDDKANVDGNYQSMTVGLSNNLDSKLTENDQSAYNFRPTATMGSVELEVGSPCKVKSIIGGSLGFNQPVKNGNFDGTTNWSTFNLVENSFTTNNNVASFTASSQSGCILQDIDIMPNHKILFIADIKLTTASSSVQLYLQSRVGGSNTYAKYTSATTNWQTISTIISNDTTTSIRIQIRDNRSSDWDTIQVKNVMAIDLTAMFGSTIADYIYTLEQGTAGAGVAWFKRYFPKPYYPYTAIGNFVSVKTSGKKITHFNQYDGSRRVGTCRITDGVYDATQTNQHCSDPLSVFPSTNYYINNGAWNNICCYDAGMNYVGVMAYTQQGSGYQLRPDANTHFIVINFGSRAEQTYNLNIQYDGERDGEHEPYDSETYPTDDIELIGIPKLDSNNNLAFDGNVYNSDGSVDEEYAIRDLSSFDWQGESGAYYIGGENLWGRSNTNIFSPLYTVKDGGNVSGDNTMRIANGNLIIYSNTTPTGYLICKRATAQQGTPATPFTETQEVDNWGTEQWLAPANDTRPCEVPVGHDTDYLPDLKAKVESAPTTPSDDGYYVLEHDENAEGNPNQYTILGTALSSLGYVKLTDITGYDATKTQTLKNVEGTLTWVDDE